jgi:hypothetical protein
MTKLRKLILNEIIAKARKNMMDDEQDGIVFSSLATDVGIPTDMIRNEIKALISEGWIDPNLCDVNSAASFIPGQLIVQFTEPIQGTLPLNLEGEVIHLDVATLHPDFTIGGDTYHCISYGQGDGTFNIEIVENKGTKFERVAYTNSLLANAEEIAADKKDWFTARDTSVRFEWRADNGQGEVLALFDAFIESEEVQNPLVEDGQDATRTQYRIRVHEIDPRNDANLNEIVIFDKAGSEITAETAWQAWTDWVQLEISTRFPGTKPDVMLDAVADWRDEEGELLTDSILYPNYAETGGVIAYVVLLGEDFYFLNRVCPKGTAWEFAKMEPTLEPLPIAIEYGGFHYQVTGFKYYGLVNEWDAHIKLKEWLGDAYEPESAPEEPDSPVIQDVEVVRDTLAPEEAPV